MPETSIRVRVPIELHDQFTLICKQNDMTASQVIRKAMRSYIEENDPMRSSHSEKRDGKQ